MADFDGRTNSSYGLLCASWVGAFKTGFPGTEDEPSVSLTHWLAMRVVEANQRALDLSPLSKHTFNVWSRVYETHLLFSPPQRVPLQTTSLHESVILKENNWFLELLSPLKFWVSSLLVR